MHTLLMSLMPFYDSLYRLRLIIIAERKHEQTF